MTKPGIILPNYVERTEDHTFICPNCETPQAVKLDVTNAVCIIQCQVPNCGQPLMVMHTKLGWLYHALFPMGDGVKLGEGAKN